MEEVKQAIQQVVMEGGEWKRVVVCGGWQMRDITGRIVVGTGLNLKPK